MRGVDGWWYLWYGVGRHERDPPFTSRILVLQITAIVFNWSRASRLSCRLEINSSQSCSSSLRLTKWLLFDQTAHQNFCENLLFYRWAWVYSRVASWSSSLRLTKWLLFDQTAHQNFCEKSPSISTQEWSQPISGFVSISSFDKNQETDKNLSAVIVKNCFYLRNLLKLPYVWVWTDLSWNISPTFITILSVLCCIFPWTKLQVISPVCTT